MAASLTASVNPVDVWGKGVTGTTTITWSTGVKVLGRVYLKAATGALPPPETLFDGDPTNGSLSGSKALTVTAGVTYYLTLRQASNNAILATLVVTVDDLLQDMANRAAAAAALEGRLAHPQAIYDLKIQAGVDSTRITFQTVQPTIPKLAATAPDGTTAAVSLPLAEGPTTAHDITLGLVTPLAQQTTFGLSIAGYGTGFTNRPVNRVVNTWFTTSSRQADVLIESAALLNGSGDTTFQFGAGNADDSSDLGMPWPIYEGQYDDHDPPHRVTYLISIPDAPRNLWVGATAVQHYLYIGGLSLMGTQPSFDLPLTGYRAEDGVKLAWANRVYNIANGGPQTLDLMTGYYDVMFDVLGQMDTTVTQGIAPHFTSFSAVLGRHATKVAMLNAAGSKTGLLPPGGGSLHGPKLLARGANGAAYLQIAEAGRKLSQSEGWVAVTPPAEGPVTAVAVSAGRIAFFTLDCDGAVLRADAVDDKPAREWHALGGRFAGTIAATATSHAIELAAQDRENVIFHRTVPLGGGAAESDWQRLGEGMPGQFTALALGAHGFAVFALDRKGVAMQRRNRHGHGWDGDWHTIPGATGAQLGISWIEGQDLGLALVDDTMKLRTAVWRGYPESHPEPWTLHGDLQDWLARSDDTPPAAAKAEPPVAAVA